MNRESQFECDADVEQHFALVAALARRPVPPADLWERMEKDRQAAQSKRVIPQVASAPDVFRYESTSVSRQQLVYPMNEIREVVIVPVNKRRRTMPQRITPAPRTLAGLVERAGNRERKQK